MSTVYFKDSTQSGTSDTGSDIRLVENGDLVSSDVINRPTLNLQYRTDEVKRYLDVLDVENLLEASRNISLVKILNNDISDIGMLKIHKQGSSYFVEPGHISDPTNQNDYRLVITSAVEKAGNYSVKRVALTSFYADGVPNQYNEALGLSEIGDCILLRVPRYSQEELAASPKDIPISESSSQPLRLASAESLSAFHSTNAVDSSSTSIVKLPVDNKFAIVLDPNSVGYSNFLAFIDGSLSELTLRATDSNNNIQTTLPLDHRRIERDENTFYFYLSTYLSVPDTINEESDLLFYEADPIQGYTFSATDVTSVTNSVGIAPPYDYLIPLFYHAGDRIVVKGIGSVLTSEIDRIEALGFPVMLRGDGKVVSTYVEGMVEKFSVQANLEVGVLVTTEYSIDVPLPYDSSMLSSGLSIESIEVVSITRTGNNAARLIIEVIGGTPTIVRATIFDTDTITTLDTMPLGTIRPTYLGKNIEGDKLKFRIVDPTNIQEQYKAQFRINYVQLLDQP
jgi:hypothetical protein